MKIRLCNLHLYIGEVEVDLAEAFEVEIEPGESGDMEPLRWTAADGD